MQHHSESVPLEPAVGSVAVPPPLPAGWTVGVASADQFEEAEHVEYRVFVDAGFCQPNSERRALEYERWRDSSAFQIVAAPDGEIRAVVRTIVGDYAELPIGKFEQTSAFVEDPVLEYASLAIPVEHRRQGLAEELYRAVFLHGVRIGVGGIVAIGEAWLLGLLRRAMDLPFEKLGPERWYMGGDCFPMGMVLSETFSRLSARQPAFLEWVLSEIDLRELSESAHSVLRVPALD